MLKTEDPSLQETFDKLSAACKQRVQELLAPLEKEFDRSVIANASIDWMCGLLREAYQLKQLNRHVIMDMLLRLQFKIIPLEKHVAFIPMGPEQPNAMQRQFETEVAACADRISALTAPILRQYLVPVGIDALFVVTRTNMVAARENGILSKELARDYCQQLRLDLFPEEQPNSLN